MPAACRLSARMTSLRGFAFSARKNCEPRRHKRVAKCPFLLAFISGRATDAGTGRHKAFGSVHAVQNAYQRAAASLRRELHSDSAIIPSSQRPPPTAANTDLDVPSGSLLAVHHTESQVHREQFERVGTERKGS